MAARLEATAQPDQILVSCETYALIQDDIQCQPVGEVQVKGIAYPLRTYEVLAQDEDSERPGTLLSDACEGFRLTLDPNALAPDDRQRVQEALKAALDSLKAPAPNS